MTTLTARDIARRAGDVRKALKRGEHVHVTFHSKPWARIVPEQYIGELESELARLRAQLDQRTERRAAA